MSVDFGREEERELGTSVVLTSSGNQWEELMKANYKMTVAALAGVALGALAMMVSAIATAFAQDTVRVRGTIERIDGSTYGSRHAMVPS